MSTMLYRFLGRSGLKVSVLSLGSVTYGSHDAILSLMRETMPAAREAGCNFFDTAETYASGKSEEAIGTVIREQAWRREELVISTKIFWGGPGPNERGLSRKHIVEGLRASLRRLQMDYVDLVYAHRPDPTTPMEEVVRAFNWCIDHGMAFYWGTSEWSAEEITHAHAVADRLGLIGPVMEQPYYNMFHRERVELEYAPLYKKYGMGTTIWSPLEFGILTGKYSSTVPKDSRFAVTGNSVAEGMRKGLDTLEGQAKLAKVDAMRPIAERLECTLAQLALAWCLKNPDVSSVITGASRASQVTENFKALDVVPKLTPEIMEQLDLILDNKPKPAPTYR